MPTLRQFEIFVKLAETGNMGEAAGGLGLTQPALSQQLRALEDRLGLRLFERVPKGMQLTPAGRDLVAGARGVIAAARDFLDAADHVAAKPAGSIRFGVSPTIGPYLLPAVIKILHERYPDLRLFMREGIPTAQHAALAAGKLILYAHPHYTLLLRRLCAASVGRVERERIAGAPRWQRRASRARRARRPSRPSAPRLRTIKNKSSTCN